MRLFPAFLFIPLLSFLVSCASQMSEQEIQNYIQTEREDFMKNSTSFFEPIKDRTTLYIDMPSSKVMSNFQQSLAYCFRKSFLATEWHGSTRTTSRMFLDYSIASISAEKSEINVYSGNGQLPNPRLSHVRERDNTIQYQIRATADVFKESKNKTRVELINVFGQGALSKALASLAKGEKRCHGVRGVD